MNLWNEIVNIAEVIFRLIDNCDTIVLPFNSNGVYFVQSLYDVIIFRGMV